MTQRFSRRDVIEAAGRLGPAVLTASLLGSGTASAATSDGRLFSLGVASGEPSADGFVIWTRLARDPLNGGGMGTQPVEVVWEVASDDRLRNVVRKGIAVARPESGHSIHVEVEGLDPARWYWYRFRASGEESIIGRSRTAPPLGIMAERFRFAFASCQKYEQGLYTAHRHMAAEDLDLVVFLGDYIYEGKPKQGYVREHTGSRSARTVDDYRNRYAQYKLDPDLQACHATFPWVVTPDDHEVANNYSGLRNAKGKATKKFLKRRVAGYQVYYEHMPFRRGQRPNGPNMQIFRQLAFGRLLRLNVLDTRQYRDRLTCDGKRTPACSESLAADRTILGPAQERWLAEQLSSHGGNWNVLAQQVPMMQRAYFDRGEMTYSMDKWDGYVAARDRLFKTIRERRTSNMIVLSGDVHEAYAADLKSDFSDPSSPILGSEFVCTSIASNGDGGRVSKLKERLLESSAHIKYYESLRGYCRAEVTSNIWRTDFRTVDYVSRPGAPIQTAASYIVENRKPGTRPA